MAISVRRIVYHELPVCAAPIRKEPMLARGRCEEEELTR
jgi:hypothetical protein